MVLLSLTLKQNLGVTHTRNGLLANGVVHFHEETDQIKEHIQWPLAPNWETRNSFFHRNHMLGTLDFTCSEHWASFNFSWKKACAEHEKHCFLLSFFLSIIESQGRGVLPRIGQKQHNCFTNLKAKLPLCLLLDR